MTLNKRTLPAAMLALALIALPHGSQAGTITTQHGSKCKPGLWSLNARTFKATNGIWNYGNAAQQVDCPVIRVRRPTSGGLRAWIDGYAPSGSTLSCVLNSYDYTGRFIGQAWFTMTGTGFNFDRRIELDPAYVPLYSSQVVECQLPPGGGIYDIEPESLGS